MGITDKAMNMASALAVKTVTRLDDWQNELTQLGQAGLDRIKGNVPAGVTILSDDYLENMYYGGGLEARIVDLPVDHGTRKGYIIRGPKAGEDDEQPEWTPETTPFNLPATTSARPSILSTPWEASTIIASADLQLESNLCKAS